MQQVKFGDGVGGPDTEWVGVNVRCDQKQQKMN